MSDDATARCGQDQVNGGAEDVRRLIDALMAAPPKDLPAIVVIGDEAVFGITPPRRPG